MIDSHTVTILTLSSVLISIIGAIVGLGYYLEKRNNKRFEEFRIREPVGPASLPLSSITLDIMGPKLIPPHHRRYPHSKLAQIFEDSGYLYFDTDIPRVHEYEPTSKRRTLIDIREADLNHVFPYNPMNRYKELR